ncbi:hypothetical protein ASZ78_005016 [Callipepla squamata]|uniref:SET domain-containing protein n=1 Tax=Callipepla squamata TaxID=9009 RepID=A0A226MWU1_CALSU|nr:hypothetical protein ASZ78_005016 [Callipepla squamata]
MIITSEEAERRGQVYDRQGATYLFDLDYVEDVYTVDAAHYGNISHFVNHSVGAPPLPKPPPAPQRAGAAPSDPHPPTPQCDPNLQVYNVFIENLDERLPRIALFATRPIRAGEELTFDYNMHASSSTPSRRHFWLREAEVMASLGCCCRVVWLAVVIVMLKAVVQAECSDWLLKGRRGMGMKLRTNLKLLKMRHVLDCFGLEEERNGGFGVGAVSESFA